MRFADPYLLALLLLIPAAALLRARLSPRHATATFSNINLFAGYARTWRVRYRWTPTALRVVALALLVVALARPQNGRAETELPGEGIDIVLVLDISGSMNDPFGDSTRMESARRVITDFIDGRDDDRLGFVVFGDRSLVLSPLTLDYESLAALVSRAESVNLQGGTAIGSGLAEGLNLLRESKARSRVAVLLTDGQNNSGSIEPGQAARIAETLGIRVYTIGLIEPPSRRRPGAGSNVDEKALTEMARVTGGQYFAADNEDALQDIYDNIDKLETSAIGRPQYLAYREIAPYLLAAALALLALELTLRATIWRQVA